MFTKCAVTGDTEMDGDSGHRGWIVANWEVTFQLTTKFGTYSGIPAIERSVRIGRFSRLWYTLWYTLW
jgi:hypothetical protein